MKKFLLCMLMLVLVIGMAQLGIGKTEAASKMKIAAVFTTPIEEPWVNVIHQALLRSVKELNVQYDYAENVPAADFERVLREYAEKKYDIITGDSFGNEETARRVARDYPEIAFCFGSDLGPAEPNFAVFSNWIHEPAYLAGMIAGKLTKSSVIGAVGGYPVPAVNRLLNAYRLGAQEVNPDVKVKIAFLGSWFDPPKGKEAAVAQIDAGADVLYAERYGVIEAAQKKGAFAFGNMQDQYSLAPDTVVSSVVWDMWPTAQQVIADVRNGHYRAMDYREWCMMAKGGAYLAPYHEFEGKLSAEIKNMVEKRIKEIGQGTFRVELMEGTPKSD